MLLRKAELLDGFMQHLACATSVDIATAFVDDIRFTNRRKDELVKALIDSRRRGARVRVLVGAMARKKKEDERAMRDWIRWVASQDVAVREHHRSFHAKAYIFGHRGDVACGWVGSANLTASGFGSNEELLVETTERRQLQDLVSWYADKWEESATREVSSRAMAADDFVPWTPVVLESGERSLHCTGTVVHIGAAGTSSIFWEDCPLSGRRDSTYAIETHLVEVPWDAVANERVCGTVRLDIDQRQGNAGATRDFIETCRISGRELHVGIGAPNHLLRCIVDADRTHLPLDSATGHWSVELVMKSGFEGPHRGAAD